jgi:hypothetical protein
MRTVALLLFLGLAGWASIGWTTSSRQEGAFPATVRVVWDISAESEAVTLGAPTAWTSHAAFSPSETGQRLANLKPKDVRLDEEPNEAASLELAREFVASLGEDLAVIPDNVGPRGAVCWRWPEGWVKCEPGDWETRVFQVTEDELPYREALSAEHPSSKEAQKLQLRFFVVVHPTQQAINAGDTGKGR